MSREESKADLSKIAAEIERFEPDGSDPYLVLAVLPKGESFHFMLVWSGNSRRHLATLIAGIIERKYDEQAAIEVVKVLAHDDKRRASREHAGGRCGHA